MLQEGNVQEKIRISPVIYNYLYMCFSNPVTFINITENCKQQADIIYWTWTEKGENFKTA